VTSERLVSALQDVLRGDVDPASGSHLAVHGEAQFFERAELINRRMWVQESSSAAGNNSMPVGMQSSANNAFITLRLSSRKSS
jgi:hypothetical protein